MAELDLQKGEPKLADEIDARTAGNLGSGKGTGNRTRKTSSTSSSSSKTTAAQRRTTALEAELRSRLDRTWERVAEWRDSRGDDELATVIREDKEAWTQGIVSLSHIVKWLRAPLLMLLNFVEPVLAFGRVTRILFGRWTEQRQQVQEEHRGVYVPDNGPVPAEAT